ncbi:hypothetical protein BB558_003826 [Smittium angustum]|uniref:RecF/RecN/SMC N-terminal domain-containing protein n=1 Tax=Smittium angustum TaxID=133377 RepID=A0A2U1J4W9_SMIAN|nr:hypothetical protein BB558_003826 [Smittium angustum]
MLLQKRPRESLNTQEKNKQYEIDYIMTKKQRIQTSQEPQSDSEGSEVHDFRLGIIQRVELIDFMCHSHLLVDFGTRLNFINGENGSGKSAILTAITVALGGKASSTNRSSNTKGFIKEGCSKGIVKLWLYNEGQDAYKSEEYGDIIQIERILYSDNKGPSYKLKNSNTNQVISTKKSELVAITDHMAIQVENPINILSQDASREFLASTKADQLYQWFLKGTQLQQLSEDLEAVREAVIVVESSIVKKQELMSSLKAKKVEWEQKYQMITEAQKLVQKMQNMEEKLAWTFVAEAENSRDECSLAIIEIQKKVDKLEAKAQSERDKLQDLEDKIKDKQDLISKTYQLTRPLQEKRTEKMHKEEYRKRAEALEKQIISEQKRMEKDIKKERDSIENAKRALANENEQITESINSGKLKLQNLDTERSNYQRLIAQTTEKSESIKKKITETKFHMERLKQQESDSLMAFGKATSKVVLEISKTRWNGMTPVGPIGKFIKLKDRKWSPVIETILDRTLNMFMVDNHGDRVLLDKIMKKYGYQSGILVCKPELFDYSAGEPDRSFLTVLRAIEVSDELVKRQLININRIEQIILVEVRSTADNIMRSNNGRYPRNVVSCFTIDGFQVGSRTGGFSTLAANLVQTTGRLAEDIRLIIQRCNQTISDHMNELQSVNQEVDKLREKAHGVTQEIKQIESERRIGIRRMDAIRQQQNKIELEMAEQAPANIMALEAELRDVQQSLQMVQRQFAEQLEAKKRIKESLMQAREEVANVGREINQIEVKVNDTRSELTEIMEIKQRVLENSQLWRIKAERRISQIDQEKKKMEEHQKEVENLIRQASQVCAERPSLNADGKTISLQKPVPSSQLLAEIEALSKTIAEIESNQSQSIEEVATTAHHHIENYNKGKRLLKQMKQYVSVLKEAYSMRLQQWVNFRESMTVRVKSQFALHLYRRGYAGSLEFDHSAQLLNPKVNTDHDLALMAATNRALNGKNSNSMDENEEIFSENDQDYDENNGNKRRGRKPNSAGKKVATSIHQRKDTKSLSGGEKSFTTISFLLSLWEAMSCPIRALDEFDVFMDAANRAISMRMIVKSARCSPETQFLLISPQDMTVKPASDIKILFLNPPDRT